MATLSHRLNKYLVVAIILSELISCKSKQSIDPKIAQLQTLIGSEQYNKHKNFLIVAPVLCKGCMDDKILEWLSDKKDSSLKNILIVMDTSVYLYRKYKKYFSANIIYKSSNRIDSIFPEITNIYLLKKSNDGNNLKEKIVNAPDSSIGYYYKYM